jgi:hypothetical protein
MVADTRRWRPKSIRQHDGPGIGKHTLVESVSGPPIQRSQNPASAIAEDHDSLRPGTGPAMLPQQAVDSASTPHEIASHAVAGSGSQLPDRDAIQSCFGRQDVERDRSSRPRRDRGSDRSGKHLTGRATRRTDDSLRA